MKEVQQPHEETHGKGVTEAMQATENAHKKGAYKLREKLYRGEVNRSRRARENASKGRSTERGLLSNT